MEDKKLLSAVSSHPAWHPSWRRWKGRAWHMCCNSKGKSPRSGQRCSRALGSVKLLCTKWQSSTGSAQCSSTARHGLGVWTLRWGIALISDSGWKIKGCWGFFLKAVWALGNGLVPQRWYFCNATFQLESSSTAAAAAAALVWGGQPLGLCSWQFTTHQVPSQSSPRRRRDHARLSPWHLLFIDSTSGHSLKLHLCLQRSQPSLKYIKKSGGSGRWRNSQAFFDSQGWLLHRHPIANCRNRCHRFRWEQDITFNEVSYKGRDLTSEAIPDVLVICSQRKPGLLSQPAIYQIQQLILEFSLVFY